MSKKRDKIIECLFLDTSEYSLSAKEEEILLRYKDAYTQMLSNSHRSDKRIVKWLRSQYNISEAQAYRDINEVKTVLGNVKTAGKEWYRHMVVQMGQEAFRIAKKEGDAKAMSAAATVISKATNLDKETVDRPDWNSIIPEKFECTTDPTSLGLPNKDYKALQDKLMKKYKLSPSGIIEDVEAEEVK